MLDAGFFNRNADAVARDLIGTHLVSLLSDTAKDVLIIETEAYLGEKDKAAHARFGHTKRNEVLFKGPGLCYPHQIRGHWLLNVTCGEVGTAQSVLIRAASSKIDRQDKLNGPGLVGRFLGVSNMWYGLSMDCDSLGFCYGESLPVGCTPRIGISKYSDEWTLAPLRYIAIGAEGLSGSKSLNSNAIRLENRNG